MGAANAFRLAIDHPELVRGLVAVSAFASFADKPDLVAFHASQIEPLSDPVPYALAHEFQHSTVVGTVDRGWMHSMVAESLQLPAHVWRGMFAGLLQDDFSTELPRVQAPTLLAWGERDAYVRAPTSSGCWPRCRARACCRTRASATRCIGSSRRLSRVT